MAESINIPIFVKDAFKIALCKSVPISSREESSLFSAVTFNAMMYAAERLFEAGCPVIIEGNFVPAGIKRTDENGIIKGLIDQYGYSPLTYKFTGDTQVLYKRFIERDKLPERGQANRMLTELSCDDFNKYCRNLEGFNVVGEIIRIGGITL